VGPRNAFDPRRRLGHHAGMVFTPSELERADVNDAVFAYLDPVGPPPTGRERDPYLETGHHPDIVERVWRDLGADLPDTARCRVNGNPVLAHHPSGAVLALPRGTSYALWLPPDERAGCDLPTRHRWGNGKTTDLTDTIGDGWHWGRFDPREPAWCVAAYRWWEDS
jgi:hypothetical protein